MRATSAVDLFTASLLLQGTSVNAPKIRLFLHLIVWLRRASSRWQTHTHTQRCPLIRIHPRATLHSIISFQFNDDIVFFISPSFSLFQTMCEPLSLFLPLTSKLQPPTCSSSSHHSLCICNENVLYFYQCRRHRGNTFVVFIIFRRTVRFSIWSLCPENNADAIIMICVSPKIACDFHTQYPCKWYDVRHVCVCAMCVCFEPHWFWFDWLIISRRCLLGQYIIVKISHVTHFKWRNEEWTKKKQMNYVQIRMDACPELLRHSIKRSC